QKAEPTEKYQIYAGSTHAHSSFTWSHGAMWDKAKEGFGDKPAIRVAAGVQYPAEHLVLKPDWKKIQGPPAEHFTRAKAQGSDFSTMTDPRQEADFQPPRPTNANWVATRKAAADATDDRFVALTGFEHSENNGPGGKGHLNVLNTEEYINALEKGVDLPY